MDIPVRFRSKLGVTVYDIEIDGAKIKATLLNPNISLETALSEFKSHMETNKPVIGVDFKTSSPHFQNPPLVLLYTKGHQLSFARKFPKCLGLFLSDQSICFVGLKIDEYFDVIRADEYKPHDSGLTGKGAEIRILASAALKIPSLKYFGGDVFGLASKTGLVDMKKPDEASKPSS